MGIKSAKILLLGTIGLLFFNDRLRSYQEKTLSIIRVGDKVLSLDLVLGTGPQAENKFKFPYSIVVDGEGRIFVADRGNRRIQVFNSNGSFLTTIGGRNKRAIKLALPKAVALNGEGRLFISDYSGGRAQLIVLDKEYLFDKKFIIPYEASQIGFADGRIIVGTKSRRSSANVYLIDPEGRVAGTIDEFLIPTELWKTRVNVALDLNGRIFLANEFSPDVRAYSSEGELILKFRYQPLTKNFKFPNPFLAGGVFDEGIHRFLCYDLAVDRDGFIYLLVSTDFEINEMCSLYLFDPVGLFREAVDLSFPCGRLYIDQSGRFYFLSQMETGFLYRYSPISREGP